MRIRFSSLCLLSFLTIGYLLSGACLTYGAEMIIKDQRSPQEISETSRLYVEGKLVATFEMNLASTILTKTIPLPEGQNHFHYDLCGEITMKTPQGKIETHAINSRGILHTPQGHTLLAVVSTDFKHFFLTDPETPSINEILPGHSDICLSPSA